MKLHFDSHQDYQLEAIRSVTDLFKGQPLKGGDFEMKIDTVEGQFIGAGMNEILIGNQLRLSEQTLVSNLHEIQLRNEIQKSEIMRKGVGLFNSSTFNSTTFGGSAQIPKLKEGLNFTVEMETGTGKTYVYLRTIHELHKQYGFKKFIIVVPSIAIKEGVIKNLKITKEHFNLLYGNPEMDFHFYDPKKRGQLKQFATNNTLQILVINIDSFAAAKEKAASRIIYQQSDWGVPMEFIQGVRPIVIVDEPQNMETPIRKEAIENLKPLFTLRYSATHKNLYNLVYKLDPVMAYNKGLVKRIEVDSVLTDDAYNDAYIQLKSVISKKNDVSARLVIDASDDFGLQRKEVKAKSGDDLYKLSGKREVYKDGYIINEIDADGEAVTFSSGEIMYLGQTKGDLGEEIMKFQIRKTVQNHFERELKLSELGIKVLSLFFIDKVSNYREYTESGVAKGKFALWFEEVYEELRQNPKYRELYPNSAGEVHNGYFSQDKKGVMKDTKGNTAADDDTYALIMKEKEKLLSMDVPLRFIFSHSALKEGWDNPNVFQICVLNDVKSEFKRRQEIGRGMRLPVNQDGNRIFDENINILTVTANERFEDFARALQNEMQQEGLNFVSGMIKDKNKRVKVKLKKGYQLDENFKDLWNKINHKTRYQVHYDTNELVHKVVQELADLKISSPKLVSQKAELTLSASGVDTKLKSGPRDRLIKSEVAQIPDVLGGIQKKTQLTKGTILEIIKESNKFADILVNPQQFVDSCSEVIERVMKTMLVDGIKYERIAGEVWEMKEFENQELEGYLNEVYKVQSQGKTLFDYVLGDSDIERRFAEELDSREDVKFFFKLPNWFTIDTPIGKYNPDWAVILENDKKIYFVAETKGTSDINALAPSERHKIQCGRKHFEEFKDVVFKGPIASTTELSE